jgi:hypothetical protein
MVINTVFGRVLDDEVVVQPATRDLRPDVSRARSALLSLTGLNRIRKKTCIFEFPYIE